MRISDWSSDVCSSDLDRRLAEQAEQAHEIGEGATAADIITDHHLSMFARGLGIDLRRLFGRTRQLAIGEFMDERAAHRARRAVLSRAVPRDADAGVGIGEQPEEGVAPDGIAAMRDRALTIAPSFGEAARTASTGNA